MFFSRIFFAVTTILGKTNDVEGRQIRTRPAVIAILSFVYVQIWVVNWLLIKKLEVKKRNAEAWTFDCYSINWNQCFCIKLNFDIMSSTCCQVWSNIDSLVSSSVSFVICHRFYDPGNERVKVIFQLRTSVLWHRRPAFPFFCAKCNLIICLDTRCNLWLGGRIIWKNFA